MTIQCNITIRNVKYLCRPIIYRESSLIKLSNVKIKTNFLTHFGVNFFKSFSTYRASTIITSKIPLCLSSYSYRTFVTMPNNIFRKNSFKTIFPLRGKDKPIGHATKVLRALEGRPPLVKSTSVPNLCRQYGVNKTPTYTQTGSTAASNNSFDLKRAFSLGNVSFRPDNITSMSTTLTKPMTPLLPQSRGYAVRTGNVPEDASQITDPQSLVNNPTLGKSKIRHSETHMQKCQTDIDCASKNCSQVCGQAGDRHAVEHWTHGNPNTPAGTVVPVSPTDYKGNPKQQNAVVYNTPHTTSVTKEIQDLTNFVNQPNIKSTVEPYENLPK